jgi:fatty acid desaturase
MKQSKTGNITRGMSVFLFTISLILLVTSITSIGNKNFPWFEFLCCAFTGLILWVLGKTIEILERIEHKLNNKEDN